MPFDWQQLLQLAPLALAKPGSPEAAALMQGYLQSQQRIEQQQRQRAVDIRQGEYQQAQIANMEADNARAEDQARLARLSAFYEIAPQMATQAATVAEDPVAANLGLAKQFTGVAQQLGVNPAQGMAFIPNMTQVVSTRKKRQAKELYDQAEQRFGPEAMATDSITLQSAQFGNVKPSALRQMFETPAVTAQGQRATPTLGRKVAAPGTFEEYVGLPPEAQAIRRRQRKEFQQADDPTAQPSFSLQVVTNADGSTGLVRINTKTGETTRITLPAGVAGAGKPTSGGLGTAPIQLRNKRAAAALNQIETLKKLAPVRRPGPLGMIQGAGEVAKGYLGKSTKTRQFQALINPTAMLTAVAVQGAANLSDNERKAMAEMLGSIATMDYESQMALLEQASQLLQNAGDVERVKGVWRPAGQRPSPLETSSPTRRPIPGIPGGEAELRDGRWIRVK